jgi:sphinganine C4-monooxygenase
LPFYTREIAHSLPGTVHSIHHLNYVPYSFAGGYNHPVEGFSDILAAQVAVKVIGISHREAAFFYTVAALKAVDDHSGYMLPLNPFRSWRWVFGNGPVYHTVHHQRWGFKVCSATAKSWAREKGT